jgi:pyruvate formate lyase activating enzyme
MSEGMAEDRGIHGPATVRGLVSQMIHGSFVDDHGVRTTVFLKGCPLRCVWCCNPEGRMEFEEL